MKLERDGIEFYGRASQETAHPLGRQMFLSIMAEEEIHLRGLQEMAREMKSPAVGGRTSRGNGRTIFEQARAEIQERLAGNPDELKALGIAMDMEVEGFRLYQRMAQEASDARMRAFFDFMAEQEREHFRVLWNTQAYLKDPEGWLLWEEKEIAGVG